MKKRVAGLGLAVSSVLLLAFSVSLAQTVQGEIYHANPKTSWDAVPGPEAAKAALEQSSTQRGMVLYSDGTGSNWTGNITEETVVNGTTNRVLIGDWDDPGTGSYLLEWKQEAPAPSYLVLTSPAAYPAHTNLYSNFIGTPSIVEKFRKFETAEAALDFMSSMQDAEFVGLYFLNDIPVVTKTTVTETPQPPRVSTERSYRLKTDNLNLVPCYLDSPDQE